MRGDWRGGTRDGVGVWAGHADYLGMAAWSEGARPGTGGEARRRGDTDADTRFSDANTRCTDASARYAAYLATDVEAGRSYVVRAGDTLFTVALETGLDIEDVPCAIAPGFRLDQPLVIGDTLTIPPANLACHSIQPSDTLASVSAQYGATPEQVYLLAWNGLTGTPYASVDLVPGNHLRIPLPLPASWQSMLEPSTGDQAGLGFLAAHACDAGQHVAFYRLRQRTTGGSAN